MSKGPFKGVGSGSNQPTGTVGGVESFRENTGPGTSPSKHGTSNPATPGPDPVGLVGDPTAFNPSKKHG